MSSIGRTLSSALAFAVSAISAVGHDALNHCGHALISEFFGLAEYSESGDQDLQLLLAAEYPSGLAESDVLIKLLGLSRAERIPLKMFYYGNDLTLTFVCIEEYTNSEEELIHLRLETRVQFRFSDQEKLTNISIGTDSILGSGPAPKTFEIPKDKTHQDASGNAD